MSVTPRVTVVISCREDAEFLEKCLEALAVQTRPADRVIVVDNVSTDGSPYVARRFGADLFEETTTGIWPAAARGYDEALTDADIIARLDADSSRRAAPPVIEQRAQRPRRSSSAPGDRAASAAPPVIEQRAPASVSRSPDADRHAMCTPPSARAMF